jgi:hypothetical protein
MTAVLLLRALCTTRRCAVRVGVCGPKVDPELVRFSSDLDWLRKKGVVVERFNLSSHTAEFAREERVREALPREGNDCLPP